MATPLYSAYVMEVFPRAVVLALSSMAAHPTEDELTKNFGLQLLLEAHHQAGLKPPLPEGAAIFNELWAEIFPRTLTLPIDHPTTKLLEQTKEYEGRRLFSIEESDGQMVFRFESNYRAFCNAALHYVYYIEPVETLREAGEDTISVTLAIAGRLSWPFSALRRGLLWESTAFSFLKYI